MSFFAAWCIPGVAGEPLPPATLAAASGCSAPHPACSLVFPTLHSIPFGGLPSLNMCVLLYGGGVTACSP